MKFIKDDGWIYLFQKWWKLMTTIKGYVISNNFAYLKKLTDSWYNDVMCFVGLIFLKYA